MESFGQLLSLIEVVFPHKKAQKALCS